MTSAEGLTSHAVLNGFSGSACDDDLRQGGTRTMWQEVMLVTKAALSKGDPAVALLSSRGGKWKCFTQFYRWMALSLICSKLHLNFCVEKQIYMKGFNHGNNMKIIQLQLCTPPKLSNSTRLHFTESTQLTEYLNHTVVEFIDQNQNHTQWQSIVIISGLMNGLLLIVLIVFAVRKTERLEKSIYNADLLLTKVMYQPQDPNQSGVAPRLLQTLPSQVASDSKSVKPETGHLGMLLEMVTGRSLHS
ncbi:hypothetical protein F2P79_017147 [Pimephales promelas]|nr:hypothetical protein F2P79_017147 [Pimephales promelas]